MTVKRLIILPNYGQAGITSALVQDGPNQPWRLSSYQSERSVFELPKGVGHGMPVAVLSKNNRTEFVLEQVVRRARGDYTAVRVTQGGLDKTGRTTFMTVLIGGVRSADDDALFKIPSEALDPIRSHPVEYPVTDEQIQQLEAILQRVGAGGDAQSRAQISEMWQRVQSQSQYKWFTSVPYEDAVYTPDSQQGGSSGGTRPLPLGKIVGGVVLLLFLLLVLRQCQHHSKGEASEGKQAAVPTLKQDSEVAEASQPVQEDAEETTAA